MDHSGLEDTKCVVSCPELAGSVRKAVSYPEWQKILPVSRGLPGPDPTPLKSPNDSSKGQGLVCRLQGRETGPSSR